MSSLFRVLVLSFLNIVSRIMGLVKDVILALFFGNQVLDVLSVSMSFSSCAKKLSYSGLIESALIPGIAKFDNPKEGEAWSSKVSSIIMYIVFGIVCMFYSFAPYVIYLCDPRRSVSNTIMMNNMCIESFAIFFYMLGNIISSLLYRGGSVIMVGLSHLIPNSIQCFLLIAMYDYMNPTTFFLVLLFGILVSISFSYYSFAVQQKLFREQSIVQKSLITAFILLFTVSSFFLIVGIWSKIFISDLFGFFQKEVFFKTGIAIIIGSVSCILSCFGIYIQQNMWQLKIENPVYLLGIFLTSIGFFCYNLASIKNGNLIGYIGIIIVMISNSIHLLYKGQSQILSYIRNRSPLALGIICGFVGINAYVAFKQSVFLGIGLMILLSFGFGNAIRIFNQIKEDGSPKEKEVTVNFFSEMPSIFIGHGSDVIASLICTCFVSLFAAEGIAYIFGYNIKVLNFLLTIFSSISFLIISKMPSMIQKKMYSNAQTSYNHIIYLSVALVAIIMLFTNTICGKFVDFLGIFSPEFQNKTWNSSCKFFMCLEMFALLPLCFKYILDKVFFAHGHSKIVAISGFLLAFFHVLIKLSIIMFNGEINYYWIASAAVIKNTISLLYLILHANKLKINIFEPFMIRGNIAKVKLLVSRFLYKIR